MPPGDRRMRAARCHASACTCSGGGSPAASERLLPQSFVSPGALRDAPPRLFQPSHPSLPSPAPLPPPCKTFPPLITNFGGPFLKSLKTKQKYSATSADQLPHHIASLKMFGHQMLIPIPDIERTDYLLILGANPGASNGSLLTAPGFSQKIKNIYINLKLTNID